MGKWNHRVKIKHLLTEDEDEDYESVKKSMSNIAEVLDKSDAFMLFDTSNFKEIPEGDNFFTPVDYANKMIDEMYDFADEHRIWLE